MKRKSGIDKLDIILGGGFSPGTITLLAGEGESFDKTEALIRLAEQTAHSGSKVALTAFNSVDSVLRTNEIDVISEVVKFQTTDFKNLQLELSNIAGRSDILFVDSLNKLDFFSFNPEAVSTIHNLSLSAKIWNIPIVVSVGVFLEHDAVSLLRRADVAFAVSDIGETVALELIKHKSNTAPHLIPLNYPRLLM
jgi:predicted ATP-dependent serine protease